jgi:hypothetical protein
VSAELSVRWLLHMANGNNCLPAEEFDGDELQAMWLLVGKGYVETGRRKGRAIFKLTASGKTKAKLIVAKIKAAAR